MTGDGMAAFTGDVAAAQEEAVWDAKRNAVEQAVGIFLKAKTVGSGFGVEEDEIQGRTQGFVRRWEVVEGSRRIEAVPTSTPGGAGSQSRLLHIQVRATVGLLSLARRLADMADVYKDLERPRIRVIITAASNLSGGRRNQSYAADKRSDRSKDENKNGENKKDEARQDTDRQDREKQNKEKQDKEVNAEAARRLQEQLAGALRTQGFEVASEGSAEVVLQGALDVIPTVRIGDASAPYGVGDMVAACRVHLTLQAISTVSEDVLFVRQSAGAGRSFQSDQEAQNEAVAQISEAVLGDNEAQFVPYLLARWARERQEGHVVVVRADGLNAPQRDRLKQALADMRGFRRFVEEKVEKTAGGADNRPNAKQEPPRLTLHFLTRRDTRSVRRDLAALSLPALPLPLLVSNDRGPVIHCAAHPSAGSLKAHR